MMADAPTLCERNGCSDRAQHVIEIQYEPDSGRWYRILVCGRHKAPEEWTFSAQYVTRWDNALFALQPSGPIDRVRVEHPDPS